MTQDDLDLEGPPRYVIRKRDDRVEVMLKLFGEVRDTLDPECSSTYLVAIRNSILEFGREVERWGADYGARIRTDINSLSEEEVKEGLAIAGRLDRRLDCVIEALRVLKGTHETHDLMPDELADLARSYGIDQQIPSWHMFEEIQDKILMGRLRSNRALLKEPRVSDEQVLTVVQNVKGHERQAKVLNIGTRQLYRRKSELRKAGKLKD